MSGLRHFMLGLCFALVAPAASAAMLGGSFALPLADGPPPAVPYLGRFTLDAASIQPLLTEGYGVALSSVHLTGGDADTHFEPIRAFAIFFGAAYLGLAASWVDSGSGATLEILPSLDLPFPTSFIWIESGAGFGRSGTPEFSLLTPLPPTLLAFASAALSLSAVTRRRRMMR